MTMIKRRYHNFDLLMEEEGHPSGSGVEQYTVRVLFSPAGEGETRETVTLPDQEHDLLPYHELDARRGQLARRKLSPEDIIQFGLMLTKVLLPPLARDLFDRSRAGLGQHEGLRIRLRLPRRLAVLPWEYMCFKEPGKQALPRFMALDEELSIVRYETIAKPYEKPHFEDSRYVLIAMASPKPRTTYRLLDQLPREQQEITAALSPMGGIGYECLPTCGEGVDWENLTGAQREQLSDKLSQVKKVDVFHFGGHGVFKKEQGPEFAMYEGTGELVLADSNNQADFITGSELAEMIGQRGIQLVTLGACESGERDIFNAWSSVAVALLYGKVPSVVAMQFTVYDKLAAAFMITIYQGLVAGCTIDEAVSAGRKAIRARCYGEYAGQRDWGTPVLYSRAPNGYIFPPVTDETARQEAERSIDAISGLHQAWWNWTEYRVTVGAQELGHLVGLEDSMQELQPAQALLLLRSAVRTDESVDRWLGQLRRTGEGLMAELDDPTSTNAAAREEATIFAARNLPSDEKPPGVGLVSWAAVRTTARKTAADARVAPVPAPAALTEQRPATSGTAADARVTRITAALALTALQPVPDAGLARIDGALAGLRWPWQRYARKIELRGALADGDPQIGQANGGLPPWDRLGIWFWRFSQRVLHDWKWILLLTLGGGLGAGLGLGLLRALVVVFTLGRKSPASYLLMYSYLGALVGAMLCLGMLLAGPAMLAPMRRWSQERQSPGFKVKVAAVLLGALFFGLALAGLVGVRGLPVGERPLVYLFGFVLGLGLSLALYGRPQIRKPLSIGSALLRVFIAAAVSAAIQAVFLWVPDTGAALDVALSANFFEAFFGDVVPQNWINWIALLDATLAGVVLAVGLSTGLALANRLAEWLYRLEEQARA
jgi:hypothetical protein